MPRNKYSSIVYKGKTLKQWSQENKIAISTIEWRLKNGWAIERAIDEPPYNNEKKRII